MPFSVAISSTLAASFRFASRFLPREAGPAAPEVVLVELLGRLEAAGQEPAPERRVGDEADPELAAGGENLRLGVAGPERVLGLDRGDRVHVVSPADRLRRGLAEPDVEHLAVGDQLRHRADRLLDRDVGIDAVLVVEINMVGAEAPQRALDRAEDVLGRAVDRADGGHVARRRAVGPARELGRDHVLVAAAFDRASDKLLVGQRPVELGGVDEVDPELERPLDRADRLALVGGSVEGRHSHATESESGNIEVGQLAPFHRCSSLSR